MTILSVKPTRMEITKLKKKLVTAKRGHKLLKNKQDELMRQFILNIKLNKELRKKTEEKMIIAFKNFSVASSEISRQMLETALLLSQNKVTVDIEQKNIMGVNTPIMTFNNDKSNNDMFTYGYLQTNAELDKSIVFLSEIVQDLLKLSEVEKTCQLMADELQKTRRRVNALEYSTIPDLEDTIKYIRMRLDENERSVITRLMKVKEIIDKDRLIND